MAGWSAYPQKPKSWRPYIQNRVKAEVVKRLGAIQGELSRVVCPKCGAEGVIQWSKPTRSQKYPGQVYVKGFHFDHVHPRSKGGSDDAENLQLLCAACNIRKRAKVEA